MVAVADLVRVPLEAIKENPFQPRTIVDEAALRDLADSIGEVGLLQRPVARQTENGYELAFGHRRVDAIRLLAQDGEWEGDELDLEIRELSDEDMVTFALVENVKRKDLQPLEIYRSWARILKEIPNMTVEKLSDRVGLARPTVSNALRVLSLPPVVLERVDAGEMSVHAAREFLILQNDDHVHGDVMARVVSDIGITGGIHRLPDFRSPHVRQVIRDVVHHWTQAPWRPLDGDENNEDVVAFRGTNDRRSVSFDTEAFEKEYPRHVHVIPAFGKKHDYEATRRWTCDMRSWQRGQTAATREANKAAEQRAPGRGATQGSAPRSTAKDRNKDFEQTLSRHPLVATALGATVSTETPLPKGAQLTDKQREELGSLGKGLGIFNYDNRGFHKLLARAPFYMANPKECQESCTWGAQFGQEYRGSPVQLYCTKKACYEQKVEAGKEALQKQAAGQQEKVDQEDQLVINQLAAQLRDNPAAEWIVAALLARGDEVYSLVLSAGVKKDVRLDWEDRETFSIEPVALRSLRAALGLQKGEAEGEGFYRRGSQSFSRKTALKNLAAKPEASADAAACLIAYSLRYETEGGIAAAKKRLGLQEEAPPAKRPKAGAGKR